MPEHIETVRKVYEGWSRGDFAVGTHLLDPNVLLSIDAGIPEGGTYTGPDGVRNYMTMFLSAWESLRITATSLESAGESVLAEVRQAGVGRGSGIPIEQTYSQVWTFSGGRVVRIQTILDRIAARDAAGLLE